MTPTSIVRAKKPGTYPGFKYAFNCSRCGAEGGTNRSNIKICKGCRWLGELSYWSRDRTKEQPCAGGCGATVLRPQRGAVYCGDCHVVPFNWICDCISCGTKDVLRYERGVDVCKWCMTSALPGIREDIVAKLAVLHPEKINRPVLQAKAPPAPKTVVVTDPAALADKARIDAREEFTVVMRAKNPFYRNTLSKDLGRKEPIIAWIDAQGPRPKTAEDWQRLTKLAREAPDRFVVR